MQTSSRIASAFAALSLLATAPAVAQHLPSGKYYQKMVVKACGTATSCNLDFPAIPADKVLFVSAASCSLSVRPAVTMIWRLTVGSTMDVQMTMTVERTGAKDGWVGYASRHEGDFFISQGQAPRIQIQTSDAASNTAMCLIAGRLLDP